MSKIFVDQVDPKTATTLTLGTTGDTVDIPTGVGLTVTDEVKTNKISPATGTAFALGDSGDTFTVPSGATIVNSGTATGFGITAANFLPNAQSLIINGSMAVSQRSASVTGSTAGGYLTCDRVNIQISSIGTYTVIQESLTSGNAFNDGFNNAWRIDCTTADASPSASEYLRLTYRMETQDLSCFKKGTSNAQPYTLGFWVKSNKTGTAQVNLYDVINNRLVGDTYTINTANTWEYKILNYPADTSGALGDTNAEGIRIEFALDAGSTYTGGTIPSAWETRANGDRSVSDLSLADSTANDWAITGLQLEVGEYTASTIPPFQHETYGNNLQRCQRYFFKSAIQGEAVLGSGLGNITNGHECSDWTCALPVTMRALGTVTIYDSTATTNKLNYYSGGWQSGGTVNGANMQGDTMIHVGSAQDTWNADLYIEAEL